MFHNVLVCVDGSAHAQRALEEAIDLATAGHGRLTILTAISRPPYWAATSAMTVPALAPLTVSLEDEATQTLRAAVDRVPQSVPVTTILSQRPIREALTRQLKQGQHDVLVMGSRGRSGLTASFLGSVSHFALNHAAVPVLIIHIEDEAAGVQPASLQPAIAPPAVVAAA